ncbi:molybdenum cofactor biosynthesis protein B MoaB [Methanobrevibacter ruminantium M1]|uniref:Molybdenum cofactor biosynthesis protein B MoaB n=1 Tax=Methanobrevibacter ruminantium (strain ATCC 35063 / DSM 1093 / JCM 13430 / OCM 146 / M1) TaxID=634498 RepID=D3DZF4_METRM|nr:molybdenum cofactor biosynthesis protein B [Methanobrevibacter ruminantium]ADC47632.1 molybdenum cofactor biosynthesis protein B MoaB [Methanobrevibacter ruminantium M1]
MKSETMELHKKKAPIKVSCGIITLSDRFSNDKEGKEKDLSGKYLIDELSKKYDVDDYTIIPDEKDILKDTIESMIDNGIDVIITTGGTGLESRDITIETVEPLFEKEMKGFGEIFRAISYEELGAGSLLSRATAGVYKKTLIFCMPGSPNAVKTGMKIFYEELGHLKKHAQK